ncbi:TPA: AAA family ATPase [Citrobacter freundii]|uniref:AAA family ATPase n=1 Tax=Citrobacter TaxID=544 RepID=UPI001B82ED51|nr:AAA family ATPase [Citrobacter sp. Cf236]HBB9908904.1 AAA family ATPase [Citrobacter freundii]MDM3056755.1 AAA family ATPase [Citrobacter sp. Cf236]HBC2002769.1 AAA family ATPase [Citrobacter freundii]HBM8408059.1 AAA family ATPase [Citrobacter freundii]HBM9445762.1 AAA family ATPase [Citrobacter freundii]
MANKLDDILDSWGAGRNVLLYGPPATGKTRLISELFQLLKSSPESHSGILLDPSDMEAPFSRPEKEITIPRPVKVVWTTFHQSYGYEDFVLGLRPDISTNGTRLQPWAGVFLDAALELRDPSSKYKSVVIFIDEINRGNAARIFGEFMTFLDFDYREGGRVALPLPLRQLTFKNGKSEKICRPSGNEAEIPENFTFPKHIYIVSTMNSVDRAAIPIDSALARRFDRIEMRPNLDLLAQHWGLDKRAINIPTESNWETLSPFVTGYLLLDRLNVAIASDLGAEFELGHGLLTSMIANRTPVGEALQPVEENDAWMSLASAWDDVLFPQLEDRYSGRPEQLIELLRVDTPPLTDDYAWTLRSSMGSSIATRTLTPVRVSELAIDVIKRSFRWLTR